MSNIKYRPYFTRDELLEIISTLKSHPSPRRLTICQYLEGFLLKMDHGIIKPAHTLQPSIESKLGFAPIPVSHEVTGEAAYQKWLLDPVKATPKEIAEAMDWRYRNNLMSTEEEIAYESEQLSGK
jgi:hypothetical protein